MDAPVCLQDGLYHLEERLETRYGEHLEYVGVLQNGSMFRLYVGKEGTFTVIIVLPNNLACMFLAGDGWTKGKRGRDS